MGCNIAPARREWGKLMLISNLFSLWTHTIKIVYGSNVPRGFNPSTPEISKFWQSWAEFPVPWEIIRDNLIRIRISLICKLSGTPD
jgi:hypothetical protein